MKDGGGIQTDVGWERGKTEEEEEGGKERYAETWEEKKKKKQQRRGSEEVSETQEGDGGRMREREGRNISRRQTSRNLF